VKSFAFDGWDGGRLTVNREFAPLLQQHALTTFDAIANFAGGSVAPTGTDWTAPRLVRWYGVG